MKARIFSLLLAVFIVGTLLGSFIEDNLTTLKFLLISLGLIFLIFLLLKNKIVFLIVGLIFTFLLSIFWYQHFLPLKNENWLGFYNGQNVTIKGRIIVEPEADNKKAKIVLDTRELEAGPKIKNQIDGKLLINIDKFSEFKFGDFLKVKGKLQEPPEFSDFSYKDYLFRYRIFSMMNSPSVERWNGGQEINFQEKFWFGLQSLLIKIKNNFENTLEKILPEPQAGLSEGLLLGSKKALPSWLLDVFGVVGVTHIIALSGFNITIIANSLRSFSWYFSRFFAFFIPVLGIFLFVVLTGASASVVRAAVMGFLLILARFIGRPGSATVAILFAAFLMILFNPFIVRYDPSFQLSFLATLGLIYLTPIFDNLLKFLPDIAKEPVSATLGAQLMVLPLLLLQFKRLSLVSLPANTLILPFVPITMFLSFLGGLLGMIFLSLGKVFGWLSWLFLTYIIKIAQFFSHIPFASINFSPKNLWWVFIYFGLIFLFFLRAKIKQR